MSLIVVEGCDGSGKSTLLENARLAIPKRYFVLVRHSCRPYSIGDVARFLGMVENQDGSIIIDRHPLISEPTYGPILRGSSLVEEYSPERITRRLLRTVERIVYCRPPDDVILVNIEKNPQLEWVKEKILDLLDAYDRRMVSLRNDGIPVYLYDYTTETRPLEQIFFGDIKA